MASVCPFWARETSASELQEGLSRGGQPTESGLIKEINWLARERGGQRGNPLFVLFCFVLSLTLSSCEWAWGDGNQSRDGGVVSKKRKKRTGSEKGRRPSAAKHKGKGRKRKRVLTSQRTYEHNGRLLCKRASVARERERERVRPHDKRATRELQAKGKTKGRTKKREGKREREQRTKSGERGTAPLFVPSEILA